MKKIKALLVDPRTKAITEVEWDQRLPSLYKLLECQYVEAYNILSLGDPVLVWADEEYWVRNNASGPHDATYLPMCNPLVGKILIVGETDGVETLPCPIGVEDLRDVIRFGPTMHPMAKGGRG